MSTRCHVSSRLLLPLPPPSLQSPPSSSLPVAAVNRYIVTSLVHGHVPPPSLSLPPFHCCHYCHATTSIAIVLAAVVTATIPRHFTVTFLPAEHEMGC